MSPPAQLLMLSARRLETLAISDVPSAQKVRHPIPSTAPPHEPCPLLLLVPVCANPAFASHPTLCACLARQVYFCLREAELGRYS